MHWLRRGRVWLVGALLIGLGSIERYVPAEPPHPLNAYAEPSIAYAPPPIFATAPAPTPAPPTPIPPTPTAERLASRSIGYVPILMYHYIREVDQEADPLGFRLSVRPDRFAEQLAHLAQHNYTPVTVSELAACLRREFACPARPVALTFDDGYADNALVALPILQRYGFRATFYIATGLIDTEGYMSWDQVRELHRAGMEFGAHSVSHSDLVALPLERAAEEIRQSGATLARELGEPTRSFSYPAGSANAAVIDLVEAAGYTSAVTTNPFGRPYDLFAMPRRRVLGGETLAGFTWYLVPVERQLGLYLRPTFEVRLFVDPL
jgi:peptidoglycan/xylan/chitin deacetylase (PgdA/CDA1 family)